MNALFARIVEHAGFSSVYLSGAGVANGLLGQPDVGLTTLTEMSQAATNVCAAVAVPVVADADTGFGGSVNVERTVHEYERAGVAALQLEDQVVPKRCGHFDGKEVVEVSEMTARLRAALGARSKDGPLVIARTDARTVNGLDDAIDRARAYADAGADALFVEAPMSDGELAQIGQELEATGVPLIANMVEYGKTPLHSASELGEMGYRLILFPGLLTRLSVKAAIDGLSTLKATGDSRSLLDRVMPFAGVQEIVRLDELQHRVAAYEQEEESP
jgi:2-methylisocitrate lyase-like PEP mutase family enzyme